MVVFWFCGLNAFIWSREIKNPGRPRHKSDFKYPYQAADEARRVANIFLMRKKNCRMEPSPNKNQRHQSDANHQQAARFRHSGRRLGEGIVQGNSAI